MKQELFVFIQIQQEQLKLHQLLLQLQINQAVEEAVLEEEQQEEVQLKELKFFHKVVQKFLEQI